MRRHRSFALLLITAALAGGCASDDPETSTASTSTPTSAPSPSPTATAAGLSYLGLGDSWPNGAHCGGCETFMVRYADALEAETGQAVEFVDRTQQAQPSNPSLGQTSASLLAELQTSEELREAVAAADVIVIATGPNELSELPGLFEGDSCGGPDGLACIRRQGARWLTAFDDMLVEIDSLRGGEPTVVRLVSAGNAFIGGPGPFATDAGFGPAAAETFFAELTTAMCAAAADHDAACVDVRPIVNGPGLDQPGNENSPAVMQGVADALAATGLDELVPR
ncbi:hypothetical protein [Jiangella sp. DSM 45060]|uniref:hypothetical protein n=1 Tax=Jiangella sp. DSM 45060 TaxID=1798224 RepID=UPI0008796FCE|nr:hypothetical protein [Jiangella sp. DSM 45060]SDS02817.1 hypothetical protein SAMN04515669_0167 [Jiangella sp. DSM 45060]